MYPVTGVECSLTRINVKYFSHPEWKLVDTFHGGRQENVLEVPRRLTLVSILSGIATFIQAP